MSSTGRRAEEIREEHGEAQQDEPEAVDARETSRSCPRRLVRFAKFAYRLVSWRLRATWSNRIVDRADGEDDAPRLRRDVRDRQEHDGDGEPARPRREHRQRIGASAVGCFLDGRDPGDDQRRGPNALVSTCAPVNTTNVGAIAEHVGDADTREADQEQAASSVPVGERACDERDEHPSSRHRRREAEPPVRLAERLRDRVCGLAEQRAAEVRERAAMAATVASSAVARQGRAPEGGVASASGRWLRPALDLCGEEICPVLQRALLAPA